MHSESGLSATYKIWAVDGVVYGPVELSTVIEWINDERVLGDTWIYHEQCDRWAKAAQFAEFQPYFDQHAHSEHAHFSGSVSGIKLGSLRRVKVLADLNDQQLERFGQLMEVMHIRQWQEIVRQGEQGDAMYLVLDGELRVRLLIGGKETTLTTLNAGEFFGEMALFDQGQRSADVVSNREGTLLKISVANFDKLMHRAPELGAPFLFAVSKTLAARIRADNKRYKDSVNFARTAGL